MARAPHQDPARTGDAVGAAQRGLFRPRVGRAAGAVAWRARGRRSILPRGGVPGPALSLTCALPWRGQGVLALEGRGGGKAWRARAAFPAHRLLAAAAGHSAVAELAARRPAPRPAHRAAVMRTESLHCLSPGAGSPGPARHSDRCWAAAAVPFPALPPSAPGHRLVLGCHCTWSVLLRRTRHPPLSHSQVPEGRGSPPRSPPTQP
eukprot:gene19567-biopygen10045